MPNEKDIKINENTENKENAENKENCENYNPNKKRGKYAQFNLYTDNSAQMRFLKWLTGWEYSPNGSRLVGSSKVASGCWIVHEPEQDEKKQHIHVLALFDQPHSQYAYAKLGGDVECQIHGDMYVYDKDLFESHVETKVIKLLKPGINAQTVENPQEMLLYFTHETFASKEAGKKEYSRNELHWFGAESGTVQRLYGQETVVSTAYARDIMNLASQCRTCKQLLEVLVSNGMIEHVEYVRKNSYFVKTFLMG